MIRSRQFPGWQSVGVLFAPLKLADHVVDPLMLANVRKFDYDESDKPITSLRR